MNELVVFFFIALFAIILLRMARVIPKEQEGTMLSKVIRVLVGVIAISIYKLITI